MFGEMDDWEFSNKILKLKALIEKEDEQSSENIDEISSKWNFKDIPIKIKSIDIQYPMISYIFIENILSCYRRRRPSSTWQRVFSFS